MWDHVIIRVIPWYRAIATHTNTWVPLLPEQYTEPTPLSLSSSVIRCIGAFCCGCLLCDVSGSYRRDPHAALGQIYLYSATPRHVYPRTHDVASSITRFPSRDLTLPFTNSCVAFMRHGSRDSSPRPALTWPIYLLVIGRPLWLQPRVPRWPNLSLPINDEVARNGYVKEGSRNILRPLALAKLHQITGSVQHMGCFGVGFWEGCSNSIDLTNFRNFEITVD